MTAKDTAAAFKKIGKDRKGLLECGIVGELQQIERCDDQIVCCTVGNVRVLSNGGEALIF